MLGDLLKSLYRAAYALILLHFVYRIFHRLFPKMDYDYVNARMYILAYYPPRGAGMLFFKTDTITPETYRWMVTNRDRVQRLIRKGTMRVVTDAVPLGEVDMCARAEDVVNEMTRNGANATKLGACIMKMAAEYYTLSRG